MAVVLDVTLISGKRASFQADLDTSVESLKQLARRALGVGKPPERRCDGENSRVAIGRLPKPADRPDSNTQWRGKLGSPAR